MMSQIHLTFPSLLLGVIRHQVWVLFMFFCFSSPAKTEAQSTGYRLERDHIVFVFHVDAYKKCISGNGITKTIRSIPLQSVSVASEANGWSEKTWQMNKISDGWYELRRPFTDFTQHNPCQFTFVLNGTYWVQPEQNTPNRGDARSIKALGFLKIHHYNFVASFPTPTIQRHVFRLAGYSKAKTVFVAGAFNNWNPSGTALFYNNNEWSVAITLPPGGHSYKFIVNGEWMTDPANPITVNDGNGHTNSFFIIPSTNGLTEFSLRGYPKAKYVSVAGSFNGWNPEQYYFGKEMKSSISEWKCRINLRPGLYEYKFIVDGQWITDPANTLTAPNQSHDANSILILPSTEGNVSFTLKGYQSAKTVALAGTFNAWSDRRTMFFRNGDTWICRVMLKPGRYEYKFIVDGEWMLDPTNKTIVDNGFGTGNNLLTVK